MAFCKYCGKELGEDGKCTCAEFQDNEKNSEYLIGTVEKTKEKKSKKNKKSKAAEPNENKPIKRGGMFIYICVGICLIAVIVVVCLISSAVNAYKKPVESLAKGIRKADTEAIIECIYTENSAAEIRVKAKDEGLLWPDYIKKTDKAIDSAIHDLDIKRLKANVLAKENISGSNLTNIEMFYQNKYDIDIKKAYRVEVEFTYKADKEKMTRTGWLCVVKLKGEGWKYCPEYSSDSFDFIDAAIKNFD